METQPIPRLQKHLWFLSLILAPLLILLGQIFWSNGVLNNTSGWLQVLAFTFWIPAFQGMFHLVKDKMPNYAVLGFFIAIYACIGGNNFGFEGIYQEAVGITDIQGAQDLQGTLGIGGVVALYLPGILFPLSLIVLGIALIRTKSVPVWVGVLLIIAAIGFPLSRIPRIPAFAHVDNVLLLISHLLIGLRVRKY